MIAPATLIRYDLENRCSELDGLAVHLSIEEQELSRMRGSLCSGTCEKCGESHDGRGWNEIGRSVDLISQARFSLTKLAENLRDLVNLLEDIERKR